MDSTARMKRLSVLAIIALVSGSASHVLVATTGAAPSNLVVNGDFEAGNTGFSSAYTFNPGDLGPPGVYDLLRDPSTAHGLAASFGDHTSGSGLMMAVNGGLAAGVVVWSQNVAVTPNTNYELSAWVATWYDPSPAHLRFLINDAPVGVLIAPSTAGIWTQFTAGWESGPASFALLKIIDANQEHDGNDFALDDISLQVSAPTPALGASWGRIKTLYR